MVNFGTKKVKLKKDGWTVCTVDHKPSAHYEHTIAIRQEKADILSTFDFVEKILGY